jgi:hypothetical protein
MSGANNAKLLIVGYNHAHYREFTLNSDETLSLPEVSSVPWVGASKRRDIYKKTKSHPDSLHHVKFITKNDDPHAFLWQTNAEKLKNAARWGIVKTHSITGKVIGTLGQYRIAAHTRVAKGLESNSQAVKLKLLDVFQDRFEALEGIESLSNKNNTADEYSEAIAFYTAKLKAIQMRLDTDFANINSSGFDKTSLEQIKGDIDADIKRASSYYASLKDEASLRAHNRTRGQHSVMEFVKEQMIHGLYELQGINQDISYSNQRTFALTRGEFNDFIEDARKDIDDHQADLRNAVTAKHHGLYSADNNALLTYDFSADELTPAREREVLLAVSFIEGWDTLTSGKDERPSVVSNASGEETLVVIAATKWRTHRNLIARLKSFGFYLLTIAKGIFISTKPWDEEAWSNNDFHLVAKDLRARARPNEPIWRKPVQFFKQIGRAAVDIVNGVYNFGAELVIRMPVEVVNDWQSSQKLSFSLKETLDTASLAVKKISDFEEARLAYVLNKCGYKANQTISESTSKLATVEYALTAGEQNDILTAMVRGLNGFGSFFSHELYAKDPVAGLLFTMAYLVGAGAIYMPGYTSSVFGSGYVNWFSNFSYSMGSSKLAAAVAGGSSQGEIFAVGWDSVAHGPSGMVMNALYQAGEDPLTSGAYFFAAYGLGYLLVNGIAGHPIPWLSEHLKADLGSAPEAGYPIIGAKFAVMGYESLMIEHPENTHQLELSVHGHELDKLFSQLSDADKRAIDRFILVHWLSANADVLPKLESKQLVAISRQINALCSKEESESLNKLMHPQTPASIAFQLFYIPLSYIPAVLRVGLSVILSLAALVVGNPHPFEPFKKAATYLKDHVKKDLSRLLVFATFAIYIPYTIATTFIKMPAYVATMAIGRIAGLFNAKPAHFIHRFFASVHAMARSVGEFLYPARALKDVTVAHPNHTITDVEASYVKLMKQIPPSEKPLAEDSGISKSPVPSVLERKSAEKELCSLSVNSSSA